MLRFIFSVIFVLTTISAISLCFLELRDSGKAFGQEQITVSANVVHNGAMPVNLNNCKLAAEYNASKRSVSMLVMQNGKVIFEDYPNDGAPDKGFELASGTKSFAGIAAIALEQDGLLDLDEKVSKTITEWAGNPQKKDITIRQLLHLTAGLQGNPGRPPTYEDAIYAEVKGAPGEKFKYGPPSFQVFGELVYRKLGEKETIVDYLRRRIFQPIGLEITDWRVGTDNMPLVPQGAHLTARNWGKFGELIRQNGQVGGKQLLDREALKECFEGTEANPMYGITWWLNRPIDPELRETITPLTASSDIAYGAAGIPNDLVMAAGAGGQRLYVIPSRNLVVVRQADKIFASLISGKRRKFSDQEFLRRLLTGVASKVDAPSNRRSSKRKSRRAKRFIKRFDQDGDGKLSQDERTKMRETFQRFRSRRQANY